MGAGWESFVQVHLGMAYVRSKSGSFSEPCSNQIGTQLRSMLVASWEKIVRMNGLKMKLIGG